MRQYRKRKIIEVLDNEPQVPKKIRKTNAERKREYRNRKKPLVQGNASTSLASTIVPTRIAQPRQMVGRLVLETLPAVVDDPHDVAGVMAVVNKLASDPDAPVRAELMAQLPHIAMLCHEDKDRLQSVVLDHLLPLVVKCLADNDNLVRKMSQAALLVLMEQGLVEQSAVEQKVCPMILMLTEMDHLVDFHPGAVALMSKMAPLIGRSSTERLFLGRFAALCTDPVFCVRKACAANFGEFCAIVGTESTESVLLPRFVDLCEDEIWGVRKACAEVFMSVSCVCTLQTRKQNLAPVFVNLLVDQSRWVRMSAYKTLGPFISTFADPSITRLSYNQNGELVILGPDGFEFRLTSHRVSDIECARVLAEFNCGAGTLNTNGTNHNVNRDMAEVSCQADDSKNIPLSVRYKDAFHNDESDCCDVECGMGSLVQDFKVEKSNLIPSACDQRTVSGDSNLVTDESSEFPVKDDTDGGHIEEEKAEVRWVEETDIKTEEGCSDDRSSSAVRENVQEVTEPSGAKLQACGGVERKQLHVSEPKGHVHVHVESNPLNGAETFNTFQYWRVPIPELQLDISLAETGKPTTVHVKAKVTDETMQRTYASELNVDMDIDTELENLSTKLQECSLQYREEEKPHNVQICTASVAMVTDTDKQAAPPQKTEYKPYKSWADVAEKHWEGPPQHFDPAGVVERPASSQASQDIVPQQLIDHFVSMTHPSQAQKTDNEIAHHCAFSLPAVALTLGQDNWILLKDAYNALASDMQWKVRRTVASSIHQLAVILGEDLATKDLVPVFNGFIKDLDEVRIGALKHLAEFLKLLRPPDRNLYLPRLSEFLLTDNDWNWRFREELAEQLLAAVNLFTPEDTRKHISPIAVSLLHDKVAAVRQVALCLLTEVVKHVSAQPVSLRSLLAALAEWFVHSKRWNQRQIFALLCSQLVTKQILPEELFARDILPHLLDLSWDSVPNVRLSVARTLATNVMAQQFFSSEENPHYEVLIQVLKRLQADSDRDVRYFASLFPSVEGVSAAENI
ncbi:serine/threonine-protein phosphatase 4 regulatory subunit 1-like isoform X4 [Zootermopsis nevadensis]|uniref:serine/threonine-protein phosphatase 4 regulatory subunit 1-like isoform X4 n=1 Tax=Zootermopsis nevadensis TaxID=136037 RepID=UPI000B8ECD66|nr:serine/threonine-protein phosphatase 4 regulatory subunit 1-like isoform X4 [Zootermopsis nevadensis]